MKYLLEVCLVAATLTIIATPVPVAQAQPDPTTPMLRKGISVELPVASNAVPVPKADKLDALVVTVTREGSVYSGVDPVTTTDLAEKLKVDLSTRADKTVYIKADARTPYVSLVKILDSLHTAGAERVTLLTNQRHEAEPGTPVPPSGLEMLVVAPRPAAQTSATQY